MAPGELSALVLIVPSGVDRSRGRFRQTPRIENLSGYVIGQNDPLAELGLPIFIENDANAALLYDYRFGNAQDLEQVLGNHLVSGIGGAMILHGKLLIGRNGHALEVGHVSLNHDGSKQCKCTALECLEARASGSVLEDLARDIPSITVTDNYMDIVDAADNGNKDAELLLRSEFAKHLANGVAGMLNTFDPQVVIFTGALSRARKYFIDTVRSVAQEKCFVDIASDVDFRFSKDSRMGELRAAAVIAAGDLPVSRE